MEVGRGLVENIGAACPHGVRTWSGQPADMVGDVRAGRPARRYADRVRKQGAVADAHQGGPDKAGKATGRRHSWVNGEGAAGARNRPQGRKSGPRCWQQVAPMLAALLAAPGSTAATRNPALPRHCHGTQGGRYSGPMDEPLKDLTLDQLRAELNNPEQGGPTWTTEEAQLSTPYSERETWERILMWDLLDGKARFQGPPGLREEMTKLLAAATTDEMLKRLTEGKPLSGDGG